MCGRRRMGRQPGTHPPSNPSLPPSHPPTAWRMPGPDSSAFRACPFFSSPASPPPPLSLALPTTPLLALPALRRPSLLPTKCASSLLMLVLMGFSLYNRGPPSITILRVKTNPTTAHARKLASPAPPPLPPPRPSWHVFKPVPRLPFLQPSGGGRRRLSGQNQLCCAHNCAPRYSVAASLVTPHRQVGMEDLSGKMWIQYVQDRVANCRRKTQTTTVVARYGERLGVGWHRLARLQCW